MTFLSFQRALKQPYQPLVVLLLTLVGVLFLSAQAHAAPSTIELFSGGGNTTANIPTQTSQTNTYQLNRNNPNDNVAETYTPTTTVTYSISSRFSTSTYDGQSNRPDLMFGGTVTAGGTAVTNAVIYSPLNGIGNPQNFHFAATQQNAVGTCVNGSLCSSGTTGGVSVTDNYGTGLFAAVRGLQQAGLSTSGRHRVGTITVTFNQPLTNPVLNVAGLGGFFGNSATGGRLGISAEFDLTGNSSLNNTVTLRRIAGSQELRVLGNQITNGASTLGTTTGSGGASGSVLLQGRRITSLTFDVFVRGDGGNAQWESGTTVSGDRFFFGVSTIEADADLTINKSQRLGTTGAFIQTQQQAYWTHVVQYRLIVQNISDRSGGTPALYTDTLPSVFNNISVVSTTAAGGATCPAATVSGQTVSGTYTGPQNSTCTVIIQANVAPNAPIGIVTNTATVFENATDLNSANNSSAVNTEIMGLAELSITKVGTQQAHSGSVVSYVLNVT
ncbi:MAG: hypothetical protein VXW65_08435, partial [Pseudomonadota bacterium]|nr:hypothetical protein [Pseudomonadota bacterium]